MLTAWTLLQVFLGVLHPLIFKRRIFLTALLPSIVIEAVLQKFGLGSVAAALTCDLFEHPLNQIEAFLALINIGGEPASLGIFSAVAGLGIILGGAGLVLAREQNCGEQPLLKRIARAAEFLDRVARELGRRGYIDRPSFFVVLL